MNVIFRIGFRVWWCWWQNRGRGGDKDADVGMAVLLQQKCRMLKGLILFFKFQEMNITRCPITIDFPLMDLGFEWKTMIYTIKAQENVFETNLGGKM